MGIIVGSRSEPKFVPEIRRFCDDVLGASRPVLGCMSKNDETVKKRKELMNVENMIQEVKLELNQLNKKL